MSEPKTNAEATAARAAALAGLPAMGPARLLAVIRAWGPDEGWARVVERRAMADPVVEHSCRPDPGAVAATWTAAAASVDPVAIGEAHTRAGVTVTVLGADHYPLGLATDPEPPAVLFSQGDLRLLDADSRVGVVGTRRCTRYGHDVARKLGGDLAAAGVVVVSGLALGIDAAAHEGTLAANGAAPVAVIGSGHDVVYPRANRRLWRRVAEGGVLVSEAPLASPPEPWRFPARNRIIAALAQVVVVVESHRAGGSMHTVEAATTRSRPVLAVPGAIVSPASAGTNRLIAEGCAPVLDVDDVLVALGLEQAGAAPAHLAPDTRPLPAAEAAAVLDALGFAPASLDMLVNRTGLRPPAVALVLAQLEADGWIVPTNGWWERVA
jgi:DNA processing protein